MAIEKISIDKQLLPVPNISCKYLYSFQKSLEIEHGQEKIISLNVKKILDVQNIQKNNQENNSYK